MKTLYRARANATSRCDAAAANGQERTTTPRAARRTAASDVDGVTAERDLATRRGHVGAAAHGAEIRTTRPTALLAATDRRQGEKSLSLSLSLGGELSLTRP